MFSLFAISGILGGTAMTCLAPRFKYEAQIDIAGALVFISALASVGFGLASRLAL